MFRKAKVALPDLQNAYRYTFLSGKWEDAIGMKRCEFITSYKNNGYIVVEDRKIKEKGKALLTFIYNNNGEKVILTAPWGEKGKKRAWEGTVKDNGTKIVWNGWRGTQTWYKITDESIENKIVFDPFGRY